MGETTLIARLKPETVSAWNTYVAAVESRRAHERQDSRRFLVADFQPTAAADRKAVMAGGLSFAEWRARGQEPITSTCRRPCPPLAGRRVHPGALVPDLLSRIETADPPAIQDDVIRSSVL